jgi:hypothetical protein
MNAGEIPLAFRQYRELFKIHITQILTLERKSPIHAVPLLVSIACEVLGKLMGRGGEDVFADDLHWPQDAKPAMTRKLFDALRNGLAHAYGPYPILLDGQKDVRIIMTWKNGPLLAPVGVKIRDGHAQIVSVEQGEQPGSWVCLDVESLWKALNQAFTDLEARISNSPDLAQKINDNAWRMWKARPVAPEGTAAEEWRTFLSPATLEGEQI